MHRLQIFDGFYCARRLQAGHVNTDITLTGLNTPPTGTIQSRLGMVAYEGDRGLTGESATLNGTAISDALNPVNDFFNSTITKDAAYVTAKNPNYVNQMGIDIDDFNENGVIGNSATSTVVHLTTSGDFYIPAAIALTTDEWAPVPTTPPVPPAISGSAVEGQTLTSSTGDWNFSQTPTYTYQWRRCDAAGANCVDIAGATASTRLVTPADIGSTLRVVVTATNAVGTNSQTSAQTAVVQGAPPANTVLPTVTGTARDGLALTIASDGTWTGTPTIGYSYKWQRCDSAGNNCADIAGQTGTTYTQTATDVGNTIRGVVTATNTYGTTSASSTQTAVVAASAAGQHRAADDLGHDAQDGQVLTAADGTWTGTPTITYTYQWRRCDAAGANCSTSPAHRLDLHPGGRRRRRHDPRRRHRHERRRRHAGHLGARPPSSRPAPPVNTRAAHRHRHHDRRPGADHRLRRHVDRHADDHLRPPVAALRQRRRNNCADIAGQTGTTYTLTSTDVGSTIRGVVTATNAGGSATASSTQTAVIAPAAPANTALPAISGTRDRRPGPHRHDRHVDGHADDHLRLPVAPLRQLRRRLLEHRRRDRLRPTPRSRADVGEHDPRRRHRHQRRRQRAGHLGPDRRRRRRRPRSTRRAPSISGTTHRRPGPHSRDRRVDGHADDHLRLPVAPLRQRRRGCSDIAGATSSTYTPGPRRRRRHDPRRRHRHERRRQHARHQRRRPPSSPPRPPVNTALPTVTGTTTDGQALTIASDGTWTGTPTITYARQWQRCDSAGNNCADIAGQTGTTYTLTSADVGSTIRGVVTATNAGGSATATSAGRHGRAGRPGEHRARPPSPAPRPTARSSPPTTGTWTGTPTITYDHQWRRCDTAGATCIDIAGATGSAYTQVAADVGSTIRVVVTATNAGGSATATSAQTAASPRRPRPTRRCPTISGTARDGADADGRRRARGPARPTDHLRLPVAPLRQRGRQLLQHRRRHELDLHPGQPPTSAAPSASSSPRPTPAAARPPRSPRPPSSRRDPPVNTALPRSPAPSATA